MTTRKPTPEQLLAAYASGDVTDEQRQQVEQYLRDNPTAQAELTQLRNLVSQLHDNAAQQREPNWNHMRQGIADAIADRASQSEIPWWKRWWPSVAVATAVAAAVVVFGLWPPSDPPQVITTTTTDAQPSSVAVTNDSTDPNELIAVLTEAALEDQTETGDELLEDDDELLDAESDHEEYFVSAQEEHEEFDELDAYINDVLLTS